MAYADEKIKWLPAIICAIFAVLAQISPNFINDFSCVKEGTDRNDSLGPQRAVASGLISPQSMLRGTIITISIALLIGLSLVYWGGWWLIPVGAHVAIFAFAYSSGPYPLSYHGLGDVAVIIFFGVIPVIFTYYVQANCFPLNVFVASVGVGLVASNLLIVNNYRDAEADTISKKNTTVVLFGRKIMHAVYLINCLIAYILGYYVVGFDSILWIAVSIPFVFISFKMWKSLKIMKTEELNKVLAMTSINVLIYALCFSISVILKTRFL